MADNVHVLRDLLVAARGDAVLFGRGDVARFDAVLAYLASPGCDLVTHGRPLREAIHCVGAADFRDYLAGTVTQAVESIMAGRGVGGLTNSSLRARLARCVRV